MKIITNYHSHTVFCKHASETVEEVIQRAIKWGFKEWGFSGHIPLPGDPTGNNRMWTQDEVKAYIKEVHRVKEKYKDQINVLCGIEADIINWRYPNESMKPMHEKIESYEGIDYVIVGHHCLPTENTKKAWLKYIDVLEDFINYSKKFKYLGHPDIFMNKFDEDNDLSRWVSKKIISLSLKYKFPLPINILGIHESKKYPSLSFFKLANEMGATIIFEMDNHFKEQWNQKTFDKAFAFAKKAGVNPINIEKK